MQSLSLATTDLNYRSWERAGLQYYDPQQPKSISFRFLMRCSWILSRAPSGLNPASSMEGLKKPEFLESLGEEGV